jgi:sulfur relay (sulfurtransferase) complex TusBCD TusD component (DsrE family)
MRSAYHRAHEVTRLRSWKAVAVAAGLLLAGCGAAARARSTTPAAATGSATAGRRFGGGGFRAAGAGGFLDLAAAASYRGISTSQLQQDLRSGRSLAAIAQATGKSVQGLEQALLTAAKARLAQAVSAGRITAAQEQQQEQALAQRIAQMVNRTATATASPGA